MFRVRLTYEELKRRIGSTPRIVSPLALNRKAVFAASQPHGGYLAIGVYQGGQMPVQPRDWRFSCPNGVAANYFELWMEFGKNGMYCLHSVCINLYRGGDLEKPLLMLHADPQTQDGSAHAIYKRGPHLHVMEGSLWPDVHIGLELGDLRRTVSGATPLTNSLLRSMEMIRDQVFPLLEKG